MVLVNGAGDLEPGRATGQVAGPARGTGHCRRQAPAPGPATDDIIEWIQAMVRERQNTHNQLLRRLVARAAGPRSGGRHVRRDATAALRARRLSEVAAGTGPGRWRRGPAPCPGQRAAPARGRAGRPALGRPGLRRDGQHGRPLARGGARHRSQSGERGTAPGGRGICQAALSHASDDVQDSIDEAGAALIGQLDQAVQHLVADKATVAAGDAVPVGADAEALLLRGGKVAEQFATLHRASQRFDW